AQLKETAVRLEAQNSLNHLIREIQIKESELDKIVREHSETIEKMEGEIGRLTQKKSKLKTEIQVHSNGRNGPKASESDTIERARQQRTSKKQEAMQRLLEIIRMKPKATLSELASEIGRSKSTIGGYLSELQAGRTIEKGEAGWHVVEKIVV
ncbi:MAG: hypothetical protein KC434_08425, partial [Anaerolineales bacterium]|nr:hypothetical protein [Anaerolineales bacterium]